MNSRPSPETPARTFAQRLHEITATILAERMKRAGETWLAEAKRQGPPAPFPGFSPLAPPIRLARCPDGVFRRPPES